MGSPASRRYIWVWLLACSIPALPVIASDSPPVAPLYVILYKQGPAWKEGVPMQKQDAIGAHYRYMMQQFEAGTILDAGPTLDEPGGVVILKADSLEAAPSITRKMFTGEVHGWSPSLRSPEPLPGVASR